MPRGTLRHSLSSSQLCRAAQPATRPCLAAQYTHPQQRTRLLQMQPPQLRQLAPVLLQTQQMTWCPPQPSCLCLLRLRTCSSRTATVHLCLHMKPASQQLQRQQQVARRERQLDSSRQLPAADQWQARSTLVAQTTMLTSWQQVTPAWWMRTTGCACTTTLHPWSLTHAAHGRAGLASGAGALPPNTKPGQAHQQGDQQAHTIRLLLSSSAIQLGVCWTGPAAASRVNVPLLVADARLRRLLLEFSALPRNWCCCAGCCCPAGPAAPIKGDL